MEEIANLSSPLTFCGISPNTDLNISDVPFTGFSDMDVTLGLGD